MIHLPPILEYNYILANRKLADISPGNLHKVEKRVTIFEGRSTFASASTCIRYFLKSGLLTATGGWTQLVQELLTQNLDGATTPPLPQKNQPQFLSIFFPPMGFSCLEHRQFYRLFLVFLVKMSNFKSYRTTICFMKLFGKKWMKI